MRSRVLFLASAVLFLSVSPVLPAQCQDDSSSQNTNARDNNSDNNTVEGTVVSVSRDTMVVRTGNDQFQLFTYDRASVRSKGVVPGARVRVTAGAADENGTRSASNVEVLSGPSTGGTKAAAPPAPVPGKVQNVENEIRREGRRWDLGVRAGAAFDPELFLFGVQSRMGPIISSHAFFRPNAEFAFGEVTDLIALNLEGVYQFGGRNKIGTWTPYAGAGPALIFIHQSYAQGRDINFSNFDYETGFNVLVGMRKNRTFVEVKTSLWSGPAPKLRIIVGYTF